MRTNRERILIVDDEAVNLQVLEAALATDYEIITAAGGHEAISMVKQRYPDLILLDAMMPDLDGFDTCRIIKAEGVFAHIPIIFMTALNSTEDELRGLEAGAIDYLSKPVNIELLRMRIFNHMELIRRNAIISEQCDLLDQRRIELEATLGRIKVLEGIIPICMHCKSIRNAQDTWQRLEEYMVEHTDAMFSHGICPNCISAEYARLGIQKR